jgi:hypothetical protein
MQELLVKEHIRELHAESAARIRDARDVRDAGRQSRVGTIWRRLGQAARHRTPGPVAPAHRLEPTISNT